MKKLMDRLGDLLHLENRERAAFVTLLLTVLLLTAFLLVNFAASLIPSHVSEIDITPEKMFTLTDETKRVCEELDRDVYLWLLSAGEDGSVMETFIERYTALSPHVHAALVNTDEDTDFAATYGASEASNYSIIVECGSNYRVLDYADLYYTAPETYDEYFLGEYYVTNAIALCSADALPLVLAMNGHGEDALPSSFTPALSEAGIALSSIRLTNEDGTVRTIPGGCATLLFFSPKTDLTEAEADAIAAYLEKGGKWLVVTDADYISEMPNLLSLMGKYGMTTPADGKYAIYEGSADYLIMQEAPYLMISPVLSHAATSGTQQSFLLNYAPHPIFVTEDDRRVTPLLVSSTMACIVTPVTGEDGTESLLTSEPGSFCSGAISEDAVTGAAVIWLGSSVNYSEAFYTNFGASGYTFLMTLLNWSSGADKTAVQITPVLTSHVLTASLPAFLIFATFSVILLPAGAIVVGIVLTKKRKRK